MTWLLLPFFLFVCVLICDGFKPHSISIRLSSKHSANENSNIANEALFKSTELFGKILSSFGSKPNSDRNIIKSDISSLDINKKAQIIKKEYENLFWITGNMEMSLWESNCTFADPFSSFGGEGSTNRFKTNADNLSRLILDPIGKVTECTILRNVEYTNKKTKQVEIVDIVNIGWSFSSQLKLPWKPILAAAGVTSHYISKTNGKIFYYQETWKSKPGDVIKRLFVPGKRNIK